MKTIMLAVVSRVSPWSKRMTNQCTVHPSLGETASCWNPIPDQLLLSLQCPGVEQSYKTSTKVITTMAFFYPFTPIPRVRSPNIKEKRTGVRF